ncbi:hypothetical protein AA23498_2802 [Acetobacter nitrogenifigens DSM 23921 = NBRC 105050]|nr:hypothetical protein AA23498_2802 [Acetobacter nitrogenifigens DSM 23921 = NBRC 105050]
MAFLFHPPFLLPKRFIWRPLREERYIVILSTSETLRDALQLLRERPFLRYDQSLWSGQIADNYLRQHHIRPHVKIELDALDAIAVLVHRGMGVALVPDRSIPWPEGLSIEKLSLPEPSPMRELGLLWPSTSAHTRLIQIVEQETANALRGVNR